MLYGFEELVIFTDCKIRWLVLDYCKELLTLYGRSHTNFCNKYVTLRWFSTPDVSKSLLCFQVDQFTPAEQVSVLLNSTVISFCTKSDVFFVLFVVVIYQKCEPVSMMCILILKLNAP